MKRSKAMRAWNLLYPVCIYYAVTAVALVILDFILPQSADSKLLRQLLTSLAALPFLLSFYHQDNKTRERSLKNKRDQALNLALAFLVGACFAVAFNNLLGMIRIADYSPSYAQAEQTFYTGRLALEIVSLCIVIPIVEELLYRGIVYFRSEEWLGRGRAMILSAVIFGLVHMNLAQFVYASAFGILLAWLAQENGNIFCSIAAHMAANLTSALRAETRVFAFLDQGFFVQLAVAIVLFAVSAAGIWAIRRRGAAKE